MLNTSNAADKRVYDILAHKFELFDGVFGASNIALGILESGINFENEILEIYQRCSTSREFEREFNKLNRHLEAKRNKKARQLRDILLSKNSDEKISDLNQVRRDIDRHLRQVEYWEKIEIEDFDFPNINYWQVKGWGEEKFGSHGYIFVGAMYNNAQLLFPVLLLTTGEVCAEVEELTEQAKNCTNFLEKVDIRKKADEKLKKAQDMQAKFHQHEAEIHAEAEKSIAEFDKKFNINPVLLIKIVLKY